MAEPYSVVPFSPLRRVIAARMSEAQRTIPQFRLLADIEVDALLALREQANAAECSRKITLNDCLVKACAGALLEHPEINCQLVGEEIHQYFDADISVVVAVPGGLAAPILRGANHKSVAEIAIEMRELIARAAAGQLKMHEILGGSFSISNLGGYGVDQFDAIINPPQCGILAVGRVKPRAVVSGNGETRFAQVMRVTLSLDHRVIDGVAGAKFVATLRRRLEHPQALFEEG